MRFRQRFRCWACKSSFSEVIGSDDPPDGPGRVLVWTMCHECGSAVMTSVPMPDPRHAPWSAPEYWTGDHWRVNQENRCDL